MRRILEFTVVAVVLFLALPATSEEMHVRASLVSDADAIEAGTGFALGVLFEPEPGWHIYWRNPGEAGLATEVDFELAEGFRAGEVGWPAPIFFEQSGGLVGYGYEKPVVLAAEVQPPAAAPARTRVMLAASWLACKEVCVFESAELSAELPLAGAELAGSKTALAQWRRSLPAEDAPAGFSVNVTGGPVPETGAADLVIWLSWINAPSAVELFPDPGPGLKVENLRVRTRGTTTRADLTVSRLKHPSGRTSSLRSLVVTTDREGARSAAVTHIELERKTQ